MKKRIQPNTSLQNLEIVWNCHRILQKLDEDLAAIFSNPSPRHADPTSWSSLCSCLAASLTLPRYWTWKYLGVHPKPNLQARFWGMNMNHPDLAESSRLFCASSPQAVGLPTPPSVRPLPASTCALLGRPPKHPSFGRPRVRIQGIQGIQGIQSMVFKGCPMFSWLKMLVWPQIRWRPSQSEIHCSFGSKA